jgi:LPXTG-site transpeptidase (sortase) family protein
MLGLRRLSNLIRGTPARRRLLLGAGVLSFVGGLSLLGVAVVLLTSGEEEAPGNSPEVVDLGNIDLDKLDRLAADSPTPAPPAEPPLGDQPYTIVIEKLGVTAPVSTYGLDDQAVPEVPTGPDAKQVVAWYDFSARPGTGSNAVFAGHVTWNGPAVFYKLGDMAAGDTIRLKGADGTELVYTVSSVFSVDPTDPDSVEVMHSTDRDVVTLITCTGTYTNTNDPVFGGEYDERLIVRAELTSVSKPASVAAGG